MLNDVYLFSGNFERELCSVRVRKQTVKNLYCHWIKLVFVPSVSQYIAQYTASRIKCDLLLKAPWAVVSAWESVGFSGVLSPSQALYSRGNSGKSSRLTQHCCICDSV